MRVAILDIGSNSVLMLIAERVADGWRVLSDQTAITRLGEGFEPDCMLQPFAIQRTLDAIEGYLQQCRTQGVEQICAVATAVVRRAVNPQALVQPLSERGCPVRVLSEREEAELSFLSVALDPDIVECGSRASALQSLLVVDIGGGSVEFAYGEACRNPSHFHWRSLPIGAMRLREQHAPSDRPDATEIESLRRWLDESLAFLKELPTPHQVATVGGTGVNLALLWHALHGSPARVAQVHGFTLTSAMVSELVALLIALGDAERAQLPGIEPERAPILHLGALVLERVMAVAGMPAVRVSTYGLRYGVLWTLFAT